MTREEEDLKIGEWATDDDETFLIVKIDDWPIPGTTMDAPAYYDIYYGGHITYHCEPATQEEIERACKEMLKDPFEYQHVYTAGEYEWELKYITPKGHKPINK